MGGAGRVENQFMRKWILRGLLGIFLCAALGGIWIFFQIWPSLQWIKAHREIWKTTSPARLQLLARQSVRLTKKLSPSGEPISYYRDKDIPAGFRDLDPTWISVQQTEVMIELLGGFDHFGFLIRQTEDNPSTWEIIRYDEEHSEQISTFNSQAVSEQGNPSP